MDETTNQPGRQPRRPALRLPDAHMRVGAVVALAALAAFAVWLVVRGRDGSTPLPPRAPAVAVTPSGLQTLASSSGVAVNWAGSREGYTYELTKTDDNRVWVRYLPPGAEVGADEPYLTIGTYPLENAYAVTQTVSKRTGNVPVPVANGGVAFYNESSPTSVYFAYPGANYQVEVYDPTDGVARELVSSGKVVPVTSGTSPASPARTVDESELEALAGTRAQPIYWAGPQDATSYEVTETTGGSIYLRYLPSGAKAGVNKQYLTIGSYPLADAFNVTSTQANKAGSVKVSTPSGTIAFYAQNRPTNVYVAFRGVDEQIEVFDPRPGRALTLVTSGRLTTVG